MADDQLAKTLIIVICVMLALTALAFILVVALEPHRRQTRDECAKKRQDPVVVGSVAARA